MNKKYKDQVSLLIRILPVIAKEKDIALHGGTAINLFRREMPRLSVDIDLTYLPLKPRDVSLDKLNQVLSVEKQVAGSNRLNQLQFNLTI